MTTETSPLREWLAPVEAGLASMRTILAEELTEPGLVGERMAHIARYRGKELRAAMVLLSAQLVGNASPEMPHVAAVLELIHLATLVHDDVLDGADLRRNLPSVHAEWDEQTAILLGDMLYSRAFHLSTRLESVLAARLLSLSAQRICGGEIEQAGLRYSFELDQATYESIASAKTAELYGAACELGVRYRGGNPLPADGPAAEMRQFGLELGLAFQIIDDVLDLTGNQREVGKRVGNDVEDGKVTLPVLFAYEAAPGSVRTAIRAAYQDPQVTDRLVALQDACDLGPGIAYARERSEALLGQAQRRLLSFPNNTARQSLEQIVQYIPGRKK